MRLYVCKTCGFIVSKAMLRHLKCKACMFCDNKEFIPYENSVWQTFYEQKERQSESIGNVVATWTVRYVNS